MNTFDVGGFSAAAFSDLQPSMTTSSLVSKGDDAERLRIAPGEDSGVIVMDDVTDEVIASFTSDQLAGGLDIKLGGGDDWVFVEPGVAASINIAGEDGNDVILGDLSTAGLGLSGGQGNDVLRGGSGGDWIDGGDGDDWVVGRAGSDYLRGGSGADLLLADGGRDAVYADTKDRYVDAGSDTDVDLVTNESANQRPMLLKVGDEDVVVDADLAKADDFLKEYPNIRIEGSEEFVSRTRSDIAVMLGSESGSGLLHSVASALTEQGESLVISESNEEGGTYQRGNNELAVGRSPRMSSGAAPVQILNHELVHAYQDLVSGYPEGVSHFENGVEIENTELQATGLSWRDQEGVLHDGSELPFTVATFNAEMGFPERTNYGGEEGEPLPEGEVKGVTRESPAAGILGQWLEARSYG